MKTQETINKKVDQWLKVLLGQYSKLKGEVPDNLSTLEAISNAINNDPDFYNTIIQTINKKKSVENEYPTVDGVLGMLAKQSEQTANAFQSVVDASADPTVTSGYAYYEYLGVANGLIGDYRKLSEEESMDFVVKTKLSEFENDVPFISEADLKLMNEANLIIGGIGKVANTDALIDAYIGQRGVTGYTYKIIGDDVYFIFKEYFALNPIKDNPNLTYIVENKYLSGAPPVLIRCSNLEYLKVTTLTIDNPIISHCPKVNWEKCEFSHTRLSSYWSVSDGGASPFYYSGLSNLKVLNLPNVTSITNQMNFAYCNALSINLPNLLSINIYRGFAYYFGTLNIQNCKTLGSSPSVNTGLFEGIDSRTTINCHYSLKTANAGSPDAHLVYAISRGATVNYVGQPPILSVRNENDVEQFSVNLNTENLQLSGGTFDPVNKRFTVSSGTILNTYYVDCVNGNDITGVVGNRSKPFKTIDAVFPLLTFLGTNIWEEIVLINNGTYIINSVPTINTANYRIISDKTVLLDYSANTNISLGGNSINGCGISFIIPKGDMMFSSTVNQSFGRIFDLELIVKKLTTKTASLDDSLFNLNTNNSLKYVSINELILNSMLFNGGSGGGICKIEIGSIITNLVYARILSTSSGNADIKIGNISGTGGIVLYSHKGTTTVNDINTTGQVVLNATTNDGTIIFNNSLITNSWTITDWKIGNLTLKGVIKEGSGNMVDGAIVGSSKTLTFDNFRCNLGSGRIKINTALTFNIINSIIKFNTTFYLLDNTTTVINLYGSVGLYSTTPTVICSDTETSTINDYGGLKTNIPAYGANVTFNQKYI